MVKKKYLGSLLVEFNFVTQEELDAALAKQKQTGRRLGEILIEEGKITQQNIEWVISKQLDIPFIIPDAASIDPALVCRFPREFLFTNRILPMYESDGEITIVTDDPFNREAIESVGRLTGKHVNLAAGSGTAIEDALQTLYRTEGSASLVEQIERILGDVRETAFYRLDFMLSPRGTVVNAYGFGVLKQVLAADDAYTRENLFKSLGALDVRFLYEESASVEEVFVSVYPVEAFIETMSYPVVLGSFGLGVPDEVCFSDLQPQGLSGVFHSPGPVHGYKYLAFKGPARGGRPDELVYTVDTAPHDFVNHFVKAHVPITCLACSGAGCEDCRTLGLSFRQVEGMQSQRGLHKLHQEG
jgi:type IV pilus assembly protein PilB